MTTSLTSAGGSVSPRAADVVAQQLRPFAPKSLLEWGVGKGTLTSALLRELGQVFILGVDCASGQIEAAQARFSAAQFLCRRIGPPIDMPSGSFDALVGAEVLEGVNDAELTSGLKDAFRMVRAGGCCCFAFFDHSFWTLQAHALGATLTDGEGVISAELVASALDMLKARHPAQFAGGKFEQFVASVWIRRPETYRAFFETAGFRFLHCERVVEPSAHPQMPPIRLHIELFERP